jgi:hypothetical protein
VNRYRGSENRTLALARPLVGMTVGDALLLGLPHVPEADREVCAWEFTGFPWFFAPCETEPTPTHVFLRQLRDLAEGYECRVYPTDPKVRFPAASVETPPERPNG